MCLTYNIKTFDKYMKPFLVPNWFMCYSTKLLALIVSELQTHHTIVAALCATKVPSLHYLCSATVGPALLQ